MTEDEARHKWCPFTRVAGGEDWTGSSNREPQCGHDNIVYKCIASACMMWIPQRQVSKLSDENINYTETVGGCCGFAPQVGEA